MYGPLWGSCNSWSLSGLNVSPKCRPGLGFTGLHPFPLMEECAPFSAQPTEGSWMREGRALMPATTKQSVAALQLQSKVCSAIVHPPFYRQWLRWVQPSQSALVVYANSRFRRLLPERRAGMVPMAANLVFFFKPPHIWMRRGFILSCWYNLACRNGFSNGDWLV